MLQALAEVLMSAQVSMQCQAAYGERSDTADDPQLATLSTVSTVDGEISLRAS